MAAPSNTVWGSVVYTTSSRQARLGLSITLTSTNTTTTINAQVWYWTKYTVSDSSNTLYVDDNSSNATTDRGSVTISTTVSSGSGWSTTNQVLLKEYTFTKNRTTSSQTYNYAAKLAGVDVIGTTSVYTSYTIPALSSYTVTFNANGGSGAPGSQTKWYGTTLTLSSTKPTRSGYTFSGWATSSSGSVAYAAGGSYTANASITLYAVWTAVTYTVTFNANGGSGAPSSQTKTHGVTLTLSSTKPTRTNYTFSGWATASTGSVAYAAGGSYTANASITLYAVWTLAYTPPRITNFSASRCTSGGTVSDSGTYAAISFSWATDYTVSSITIKYKRSTATTYTSVSVSASGTSGTVSKNIVGSGALSTEYDYDILVTVTDSNGDTQKSAVISSKYYTIDFYNGGKGIALGKAASATGLDVDMTANFEQAVSMGSTLTVTGVLTASSNVGVGGNLTVTGTINSYTLDLSTSNTTDTWVPVINDGVIEHRVIPADIGSWANIAYARNGIYRKYGKLALLTCAGTTCSSVTADITGTAYKPIFACSVNGLANVNGVYYTCSGYVGTDGVWLYMNYIDLNGALQTVPSTATLWINACWITSVFGG